MCFGQKSARGVLLVEPLLGLLYSFLLLDLLWVPLMCAENVSFPLAGWILGVTQTILYPLGETVLQHHPWGHPQCARASRDSGSFCLRVVCGEGINGLGVLSVPSSFLQAFSWRGLSVLVEHLQFFIVMGLYLSTSCPDLPLQLMNFSLHSPQAPLHGSRHSLSQIIEVRGGISGTYG